MQLTGLALSQATLRTSLSHQQLQHVMTYNVRYDTPAAPGNGPQESLPHRFRWNISRHR